jgi:predicted dehydrogenase
MFAAPVRILVVGVGSIGERHLRCFQQTIDGHFGFVEPFEKRRQEVGDRYGIADRFATLDEACRQDWDAAVVCTPANLHIDHVAQLAPRCRGFLIEKPLTTNPADVPRLRAAVAGKPVQIAYLYRVHPAVEAVRRLIGDGSLGEILQLTIVGGQHFPTFRPAYREIYYADRRTGGGAIQDASTHLTNLAHHLVGRFDWVFCDYAHQALEGVQVEDTVDLTARAGGGKVLVSLAVNQFMAPNETRITVNGSRGSARIHTPEHRYGVFRHGDADWTWSEPLLVERDDWFKLQARRFLEVLAGREAPTCTLDEAEHTMKIDRAMLESAGTRRVDIVP